MPGKHGVVKEKDPAHDYWNEREQGFWNLIRFGREAYWGVRGYSKSHFFAPPEVSTDAVLNDPARANWDKELRKMGIKYPKLSFLSEQWRLQNESQALGENPLPVEAGQIMLEGLEQMGSATTLGGKLGGHWHAQIHSLGGEGFRGGASYFMHALALPVQWPAIAARHFGDEYLGIPEGSHPVRDASRKLTSVLTGKE